MEAKNYDRIAEAIDYIRIHFKEQPSLDVVAEKIHLSPFHFQKIFTEWAGVSPKKFLQYTSVEYAKSLLKHKEASLFDVAFETGLSGTGRLHDLFVNIEGMTPGDYKNGGESLTIRYSFSESPFGKIMIASTKNGICHIVFTEDEEEGRQTLKQQFPKAVYKTGVDHYHEEVIRFFGNDIEKPCQIKLHLKGTPFQLKVWDALLKIPSGVLTTYGDIAHSIDSPKASRAVGTAIGSNPIAYIIPCHRVIQSSGNFGGYMWGPTRKTAIIGWEAAQLHR